MKQFSIFLVVIVLLGLSSCSDIDDDTPAVVLQSEKTNTDQSQAEYVVQESGETIDALEKEIKTMVVPRTNQSIFYNLSPIRSCPGQESLLFLVQDDGVDQQYAVRFVSPYGNEYFIGMKRYSSFQYAYVRLNTPGRWHFEYVDNATHNQAELLDALYFKDITGVTYDGTHASLAWSYSSDAGWMMTCGHGCGAHTTGNGEYFAQDWALSGGTLGESMKSPFDGIVSKVGYAANTYGNYVDVKQKIGSYHLKFRVAHLQTVSVVKDQRVFAGSTQLGTIGSTGNSSGPHAHCVVYDITDGQSSVPFDWNADCQGGVKSVNSIIIIHHECIMGRNFLHIFHIFSCNCR